MVFRNVEEKFSMLSGGNIPCFCHFFRTMRISRLIFMILAVFLMMTAISYYTLTHLDQTRNHGDVSSDNVRRMLGLLDVDDASISGTIYPSLTFGPDFKS